MPGPVLTVIVSESAHRGFWAGPLIVLGHGLLEAALLIFLVLGFSKFFQVPMVIGIIGIAGSLVLFWLAFGMFKEAGSAGLDFEPGYSSLKNPVLAGMLTSLANPYWSVWWATIGLGYLVISITFGIKGVVIFFFGHIISGPALVQYRVFPCIEREKIHRRSCLQEHNMRLRRCVDLFWRLLRIHRV